MNNLTRPSLAALLAPALALAPLAAGAAMVVDPTPRWTYQATALPTGFNQGAAEIVTHDPSSGRVFVVNGFNKRVDVLDAATGARLGSLDVSGFGSPNSVAAKNGKVAVAVENANRQAAGRVVFFDANDASIGTGGTVTGSAAVGAVPDMVTFTADGLRVLVANEGEPNSYNQPGSVDPEGSISIVEVANPANTSTASLSGFTKTALVAAGVRITGPNATAAQDLEPEYITLSPDGSRAYVTLQENNAIAELDLGTGSVTAIRALGTKDHALAGNGLDASDRDNAVNIANRPVKGMYMPDTIASYAAGGRTYLVTANEGDSRDYTGFTDEIRVGNNNYTLDPTTFPDAATLKQDGNLGRLTVSRVAMDGSVPTSWDQILAFGGRSFSIWDAATGDLVFDSGDDFERITAGLGLTDQDGNPVFNSDNNDNGSFDGRSDNKGPEPEALAIGRVLDRTLAFIGLERIGGIMVYDVTDPTDLKFLQYLLNRNFGVAADTAAAGDLGPEGLYFISAEQSPTGRAGLLVANEVSGTVTFYDVPAPGPLLLIALGLGLLGRRRYSGASLGTRPQSEAWSLSLS